MVTKPVAESSDKLAFKITDMSLLSALVINFSACSLGYIITCINQSAPFSQDPAAMKKSTVAKAYNNHLMSFT
jgi:hypothetical protein